MYLVTLHKSGTFVSLWVISPQCCLFKSTKVKVNLKLCFAVPSSSVVYYMMTAAWNQHRPARQAGMHAEQRRVSSSFSFLGAVSQSGCSYTLYSRIKRQRGRVVYETAEPRLQIAGPDLPARCQLISAFQKRSRGTMDRLTPPYKRGDWLTVNKETGRERDGDRGRAANTSSDCPQRIWHLLVDEWFPTSPAEN